MDDQLKEGVKILGLACSSFNREKDKHAWVYGVVVRGAALLEGVMRTKVTVDGEDATQRIVQMVEKSPHFHQLKMIMVKGLTLAGFNYLNIKELYKETTLPVIVLIDHKPNLDEIYQAIQHVPNWERRFTVLQEVNNLREIQTNPDEEALYVQSIGYDDQQLNTFLKKITLQGRMPEPVRVARLIASLSEY